MHNQLGGWNETQNTHMAQLPPQPRMSDASFGLPNEANAKIETYKKVAENLRREHNVLKYSCINYNTDGKPKKHAFSEKCFEKRHALNLRGTH